MLYYCGNMVTAQRIHKLMLNPVNGFRQRRDIASHILLQPRGAKIFRGNIEIPMQFHIQIQEKFNCAQQKAISEICSSFSNHMVFKLQYSACVYITLGRDYGDTSSARTSRNW